MFQWLVAKYYDKFIKDAEEKGLRDWRRSLLQNISGEVLEIGCGTGLNLEFYPETVTHLILAEPSAAMREKLTEKTIHFKKISIEISADSAEKIALPDSSVDAVVSTLVLCSVKNLERSLAEIHRVLRPQGKLVFIEHVAATTNPKRYQWQRRLAFLWKIIFDGCHTHRHTEEAITQAGFKIETIERQSMRGVPPIVRPSIRGIAIKN